MKPQNKLRTANVLMLAGLAPLALAIGWVVEIIVYAQTHKGQMGGNDVFLMIVLLLFGYAFALVVAGGGALWSTALVRGNAGLRTRPAAVIRAVVVVALLAPLLCYLAVSIGGLPIH